MKEALGSFKMAKKMGRAGRTYFSPRIYLPTKLVTDSAFPLRSENIPVLIRIRNRKIIVEKASQRALERLGYASEAKDTGKPSSVGQEMSTHEAGHKP